MGMRDVLTISISGDSQKLSGPSESSEEQFQLEDVHKGIHPSGEGKGLMPAMEDSSALGRREYTCSNKPFLPPQNYRTGQGFIKTPAGNGNSAPPVTAPWAPPGPH